MWILPKDLLNKKRTTLINKEKKEKWKEKMTKRKRVFESNVSSLVWSYVKKDSYYATMGIQVT